MERGQKFLRVGAVVFTVLAWLMLVLQAGIGCFFLITGGEPVFTLMGELPARIAGLLGVLQGAMTWFILLLTARVIRLLLSLSDRLTALIGSQART